MQHMIFFTHRNVMPSFATPGIWIKYHILFETDHLCLNVVLLEPSFFDTEKKTEKTFGGSSGALKSPLFEAQQSIYNMRLFTSKKNRWFHYPRCSMYGLFTHICHKNQPNVDKYTIHWAFQYCIQMILHVFPHFLLAGLCASTKTALSALHAKVVVWLHGVSLQFCLATLLEVFVEPGLQTNMSEVVRSQKTLYRIIPPWNLTWLPEKNSHVWSRRYIFQTIIFGIQPLVFRGCYNLGYNPLAPDHHIISFLADPYRPSVCHWHPGRGGQPKTLPWT